MKKYILGGVLALLVGVAAVFLLKPELAFDAAPFLWSSYHKKAITERVTTLVDHLRNNNMQGCIDLTDPAFLRQHGDGGATVHFEILSGLIWLGKLKQEDIRVDEVTLGSDSRSAQVKVSVRTAGQWKVQTPYRWVRVDGKWYITF
jgi:hypothetical protein